MTASAEKFTRQTLLDVRPMTPSLFTLRTTRDQGFSLSRRAVCPAGRDQSRRQYGVARLLDGVVAP
jgi:hypothetical protein